MTMASSDSGVLTSDRGGSYDAEASTDERTGHTFAKKAFHKMAYCHHCGEMVWSFLGQAFQCEVCNFVIHDKCIKAVTSYCSTVAPLLIEKIVPHIWSEPGHFKRKSCNVCRKRLDDCVAIRCEICEYYVHFECQDFALSNCKQCATYTRCGSGQTSVQCHHWREGNIATASGGVKCVVCRRAILTECLTGYCCEWCGSTVHSGCLHRIAKQECDFGVLREIILSPSCIFVPQTDVSTETVLCIQRRQTNRTDESGSGNSDVEDVLAERRIQAERERELREREKDEDYVKVYDGNYSIRRLQHKPVLINRTSSTLDVLSSALLEYHISSISSEARYFYLSELPEKESQRRKLDEALPFRAQLRGDTKRPSVVLRFNEHDYPEINIRVYSGLQDAQLTRASNYHNSAQLADTIAQQANVNLYRLVTLQRDSSVNDILQQALAKFGIVCESGANSCTDDYCLLMAHSERGLIHERCIQADENVYSLLQQIRKESLYQFYTLRFIVTENSSAQQTPKDKYPPVAIFVSGMKSGLSQRQYERFLLDRLGKENKWSSIDVIYYEYGALVLLYTSAEAAARAYNVLKDSTCDDKQLLAMLLPHIEPELVTPGCRPLLIFVNVRSGGCQGIELISSFRKLVNPYQVFNLEYGGPLPGLYVFRNVAQYKILVCGGDGTVGWVLCCLDNVGQDAKCQHPPICTVPLGTGNDLARVLCWGGGYTGAEDPLTLLTDVIDAEEVRLDRWTVIFYTNPEPQKDEKPVDNLTQQQQLQPQPLPPPAPLPTAVLANTGATSNSNNTNTGATLGGNTLTAMMMTQPLACIAGTLSGSLASFSSQTLLEAMQTPAASGAVAAAASNAEENRASASASASASANPTNTNEDNCQMFVMNNYFGIGIDADLCLDFHLAREENPDKFNSRLHNKSVYVKMGLRKMVNRTSCKDLYKQIRLEIDGKLVELPPCEGIICLNISSWGSGANPWGVEKDDQFNKPNHYDGMFEVVAVTGVVHMGQIQSGLRGGIRIAQGCHMRITLLTDLPVQVDGEPWIQPAGQVVVLRSALRATMLRKSKNKGIRRAHSSGSASANNLAGVHATSTNSLPVVPSSASIDLGNPNIAPEPNSLQ